eukprot:m.87161 g.87161  ORF g.87161 m.87161 type:complete len:381 (-) comp8305_c2_seq2:2734-3876(-)
MSIPSLRHVAGLCAGTHRATRTPLRVHAAVRTMASFYNRSYWDYANRTAEDIILDDLNTLEAKDKGPDVVIRSAKSVHTTMPIRLARRIIDIHHLPYGVGVNPHIQNVHDLYVDAFDSLVRFSDVRTEADEDRFARLLQSLLEKTAVILPLLSQSCPALSSGLAKPQMKQFLDSMVISRISRRLIAENHLALRAARLGTPGPIGSVRRDCDIRALAEQAYAGVRSRFPAAPALELALPADGGQRFSYVPDHVVFMLQELLTNATTAVLRHHKDTALPPINVSVFHGPNSTTFKISDMGGGIPEAIAPHVWDYAFSTADNTVEHMGFGLPMVRMYAEYFGGSCTLQTLPGHGTEIFLNLHHVDAGSLARLRSDMPTLPYAL